METCNVGFDRPCLSALCGVNADILLPGTSPVRFVSPVVQDDKSTSYTSTAQHQSRWQKQRFLNSSLCKTGLNSHTPLCILRHTQIFADCSICPAYFLLCVLQQFLTKYLCIFLYICVQITIYNTGISPLICHWENMVVSVITPCFLGNDGYTKHKKRSPGFS